MLENRIYSPDEVAAILGQGIEPAALERWPQITRPDYVIEVAQAEAEHDEGDPMRILESALLPRRGLRLDWGTLFVVHSPVDEGEILVIEGILDQDPLLDGTFLSDLINQELLDDDADELFARHGVEFSDPDETGQVFSLYGFGSAEDPLQYHEIAAALANWLVEADIASLRADLGNAT